MNKQRKFGEFTVKALSEQTAAESSVPGLIQRKILITKGTAEWSQEFIQYHYINWPDFGVPYDPSSLVELIDLLRAQDEISESDCLVHCSAGVGRTGTFIGMYWIMDMIDSGVENINVYNTVMEMRGQRTLMVSTTI